MEVIQRRSSFMLFHDGRQTNCVNSRSVLSLSTGGPVYEESFVFHIHTFIQSSITTCVLLNQRPSSASHPHTGPFILRTTCIASSNSHLPTTQRLITVVILVASRHETQLQTARPDKVKFVVVQQPQHCIDSRDNVTDKSLSSFSDFRTSSEDYCVVWMCVQRCYFTLRQETDKGYRLRNLTFFFESKMRVFCFCDNRRNHNNFNYESLLILL